MKAINPMRMLVALLVLAHTSSLLAGPTRIQLVGNVTTVPQQTEITIVSATASSGEGDYTADKAIDDNLTTRWGSAFDDNNWITLDLGSAQNLASVVIDWEVASAATYEIRGSNDNSNWTVLASEASSSSADHRIDNVSISGSYRYVQMYGLTRTTQYGFSIWEMNVYGVGGSLGPDADNDGVADSADQCPGTLANTPVGADGCEFGVIGGYDAPTSYPGMNLVWSDEFSGTSLSGDWVHDIGGSGWGNNELQFYRTQNATVANGALTIEAKQENYGGRNYTSSRIKTQGLQSFQYGRMDIRAVLPQGQGLWPAAWMLGDSFATGGWPQSGEIDIMEMIGGQGREDTWHGTIHWEGTGGAYWSYGQSKSLPFNGFTGTFSDEYHVFSIIWDSNSIHWYVNNVYSHSADITPNHMTEFHAPFFFILNVAVGGNWPGNPDGSATFPQKMMVDYVRVYQ